jgi:glutamate/tyrosine decarboxylase-like PLP-dependent enzyme
MNEDLRSRFAGALGALREKHGIHLDGDGTDVPSTWFLGPKGENAAVLQELVRAAYEAHIDFRETVYPDDPKYITPGMQAEESYKAAIETLGRDHARLLAMLKDSGAFFSMRTQGHMLWDVTIPGLAGYFAAMLYNQNNVAAEASPVTTMMEIAVGDDLCRMLGYKVPLDPGETPRAWGHVPCDGSVANMEGLWMARNLKFYPPALLETAKQVEDAAPILGLRVRLLDGSEKKLADCTTWELLNLPIDEVIELPHRVVHEIGVTAGDLSAYMDPYTVSALGMPGAFREYILGGGLEHMPVVTAPSTNHYSWPKAAALLGLGTNQLLDVHVDLDARQEVDLANRFPDNPRTLRAYLQNALHTRTPVITVVAVMGSTEESAVDPLDDILELRDEFRDKGMEFTIHADAAWGGYFSATLRERIPADEPGQEPAEEPSERAFRSAGLVLPPIPETPMSDEMRARMAALSQVESVTVDPHKAGYIPYPAGGLCYRDSNMRNLVSLKAPVVFHGAADPTVGVYGIEGSKSGAAAAAVYLSHKVIRPTRKGYGRLLEMCLFSSKKLYARLRTMARPDDPFRIAFIQRIPAEREGRSGEEVEQQLRDIREWFVDKSNEEIVRGPHYDFFKQLGSDQTILTWAVNFRNPDGTWNQDLVKLNALNNAVFMTFSMMPIPEAGGGSSLRDPSDVELILTSSSFGVPAYGPEFVGNFLARLGVEVTEEQLNAPDFPAIDFNISTQMDPWFTEDADNPQHGFMETIEKTIRTEVLRQIAKLG